MLAQLERTDEAQISLTDPDSRAMAAHTKVGVGYNIQVAVDAKHKLIVEQAVTNQVVDMGLLAETSRTGPPNPGGRDDRRRRGSRLLQDRRHRGLRAGRLRSPRCQAAARLLGPRGPLSQGRVPLRRRARRLPLPGREGADADPPRPAARSRKVDYGNRGACRDCPMRARCTNDVRSVSRLENEAALDRMAERLKARPQILDRRRDVVEHPFGSIKQWMYQGAFLMRGLANVRAEFSLTALAYNLRRALNILGVEAMTAAVAA